MTLTAEMDSLKDNREFIFTDADFHAFRSFIKEHAGISIPAHKTDMVYGRLAKRLRTLEMRDFASYRALLSSPHGAAEIQHAINALTTNLTRFFREMHHFETLRQEWPAIESRNGRARRVRLWSAGCSTGEEPYSIALTVHGLRKAGWDVRVLASDIDTEVLARGRHGVYEDGLSSIPGHLQSLILKNETGRFRVAREVAELVEFRQFNLTQRDWPMKGPFDVIFCRNVLIYFDPDTQIKIIENFSRLLAPDGLLFIGHSEMLPAHHKPLPLKPLGHTTYRKINA